MVCCQLLAMYEAQLKLHSNQVTICSARRIRLIYFSKSVLGPKMFNVMDSY